ncbi:unnamed protein product [Linum tenue]|uniref:Uncharacterized protein n=1 Tax=Linum tenue TaxID=586396 RepID=A0AAV0NBM0_9ROSI|nr:unnamed protein product [Linum tenue]
MESSSKNYSYYACEGEVTTEGEQDEKWAHLIVYAAAGGTTVALACAKRLGAMLLMMERWRVQVFLLLNFLLLAIFLTSLRSTSPASIPPKPRQQKQSCGGRSESEPCSEIRVAEIRETESKESSGVVKEKLENELSEGDDGEKLTKEELNERAEAFIAKFREHLVRDAACGCH